MRKFTIIFVFVLVVFILYGFTGVFFNKDKKSTNLPEVEAMYKAPGYSTMMSISKIVEEQLGNDAILDLHVTPKGDEEHVSLELLSQDLLTEENLLRQSYPILLHASSIGHITSFKISWQLNEDIKLMSFMMDRESLSTMAMKNYATLPSITEDYFKHEAMK